MTSDRAKKKIDPKLEIGNTGPTYYEVFARANSREALAHIGSVDAPNLSLAKARAWFVFDHQVWQEMVLVPAASIEPLINADHHSRIKGV